MKPSAVSSVFNRKLTWVLCLLAISAVLVALAVGAGHDRPPAPQVLPTINLEDLPVPPFPLSKEELDALIVAGLDAPIPVVVAGVHLELPTDARVEGLVAKALRRTDLIAESGLAELLPLPYYIIVRGDEVAQVSQATGEFLIGEEHQQTFQFLIDQLGRDKMAPYPHRIL